MKEWICEACGQFCYHEQDRAPVGCDKGKKRKAKWRRIL